MINKNISLPRKSLPFIQKPFVRPHLDYGDILYDKPQNENFKNILEKIQYKVCLSIVGAIKGNLVKVEKHFLMN